MCCADQALDELEVVPLLRRRGEELRLEQAVEPEQRRVARELVLDQRGGRVGASCSSTSANSALRRSSDGYCACQLRSTRMPCAMSPSLAVRVGDTVGGERQEGRILRLDPLPRGDRVAGVALLRRASPATSVARAQPRWVANAASISLARLGVVRAQQRRLRELAVVLRDLLEVRLLRELLHALASRRSPSPSPSPVS